MSARGATIWEQHFVAVARCGRLLRTLASAAHSPLHTWLVHSCPAGNDGVAGKCGCEKVRRLAVAVGRGAGIAHAVMVRVRIRDAQMRGMGVWLIACVLVHLWCADIDTALQKRGGNARVLLLCDGGGYAWELGAPRASKLVAYNDLEKHRGDKRSCCRSAAPRAWAPPRRWRCAQ